MEMEEPMKQEIVGGIDGEKQLFCVTLGRTLAPFSFLPFVALVAFGVFTFLTLLAFLALLALLAFARNIGVGGTRAFAFPCVWAFAFTGWRRSSLIGMCRVCPNWRA